MIKQNRNKLTDKLMVARVEEGWRLGEKGEGMPWPGGSAVWSILLYTKRLWGSIPSHSAYLHCGVNPHLQRVQEATDQCFSLPLAFLSPSLFLSLSLLPLRLKSINISSDED